MIPKSQIFSQDSFTAPSPSSADIIDNTPLKRAKEMYSQCIERAKNKHGSTSRSSSISKLPPQVPEAECMKLQVDLLTQKAELVSPKPVRIKLVWLKEDYEDLTIEGGTEKKKKGTFYERMFKIDTKMKGKFEFLELH